MGDFTIYQIISLIGVPPLLTVFGWMYKKMRFLNDELNAMKLGLQALLRSQLITIYNECEDKGYAPIYVKENFENCWNQYHSLGANGVMDSIHDKFLRLPTSPTKDEE